MAAGISEELGTREQEELARLLDPPYSARIEEDEPKTMFIVMKRCASGAKSAGPSVIVVHHDTVAMRVESR